MNHPVVIPVLVIGTFALVVVAVVVWVTRRAARKRSEAMQAVAGEFGFEFAAAPHTDVLDDVRAMPLFSLGHHLYLYNMMWGTTRDLGVAIFDYDYTVGSGKNKHTIRQTVIRFRAADLDLPVFTMRPETFWHRLGRMIGIRDIHFDSHPGFSKQYLLKAAEEDAVRGLFREEVLEYFEVVHGQSVEAAGERVVVYRAGVRVEPAAIRAFLEQGFEVLALFRPTAAAKPL